jgi:hypothetical protein
MHPIFGGGRPEVLEAASACCPLPAVLRNKPALPAALGVPVLAFDVYATGAVFVILDVILAARRAHVTALKRVTTDCCIVMDATVQRHHAAAIGSTIMQWAARCCLQARMGGEVAQVLRSDTDKVFGRKVDKIKVARPHCDRRSKFTIGACESYIRGNAPACEIVAPFFSYRKAAVFQKNGRIAP